MHLIKSKLNETKIYMWKISFLIMTRLDYYLCTLPGSILSRLCPFTKFLIQFPIEVQMTTLFTSIMWSMEVCKVSSACKVKLNYSYDLRFCFLSFYWRKHGLETCSLVPLILQLVWPIVWIFCSKIVLKFTIASKMACCQYHLFSVEYTWIKYWTSKTVI